jgi:hypothetical protein
MRNTNSLERATGPGIENSQPPKGDRPQINVEDKKLASKLRKVKMRSGKWGCCNYYALRHHLTSTAKSREYAN